MRSSPQIHLTLITLGSEAHLEIHKIKRKAGSASRGEKKWVKLCFRKTRKFPKKFCGKKCCATIFGPTRVARFFLVHDTKTGKNVSNKQKM
jgi:hypothetical protein